MSRFYDVQYRFKSTKPEAVKQMLEEKGFVDQDTEEIVEMDGSISIQSDIFLGMGRSTEEAHEKFMVELLKVDPDAKGMSQWHFAEWSWDDEYGTEAFE